MSLSVIALALLAQYAGTLDLSDHVEVRARSTEGLKPNPGFDVANVAAGRMIVSDRRWDFTLGYAASVTAPDVESSFQPLLLHLGDVGLGWHDRRLRLELGEGGSYGRVNAALLQTSGTGPDGRPLPVQGLAAPTTIDIGSSRTDAAVQLQIDKRWAAHVRGEYVVSGGLDPTARLTMPLLRGPRADAAVSYRASRVDWVDTRASGLLSDTEPSPCAATINGVSVTTTCEPEVQTGQLVEEWRHELSRHTDVSIGAGASGMRIRLRPVAKFSSFLFPAASASFDYHAGIEGNRTFVHGDLTLAPMLDYVSALAEYRLQGTLQLRIPIRRTTFAALIGAVQSVQSVDLQPITLLRAEATADFYLEKWVSVGTGLRLAWQDQAPLGAFYTVMAFGYVTLGVPTIRF